MIKSSCIFVIIITMVMLGGVGVAAVPYVKGFGVYLWDNEQLLLSDQDISSYDKETHLITLTQNGAKRWSSYRPCDKLLGSSLYGKKFFFTVHGEKIYSGRLWSNLSQAHCLEVVMLDVLRGGKYIKLECGYPPLSSSKSIDVRNNFKIFEFFKSEGKLIEGSDLETRQ